MRFGRIAVFAGVMLLSVGAANATPITSLSALYADDSIGWQQLGNDDTFMVGGDGVLSVNHLHAVIDSGGNSFLRVNQGQSWRGNFAPGEKLMWTNTIGPDITIRFDAPVYGVGAQIQSQYLGAFTAKITLSDGTLYSFIGNSTQAADNSAIFVGALDDVAGIKSIRFELQPFSGHPSDLAIGTLYLNTKGVPVPEPLTLSVFGTGAVVLGAWRRRNRKVPQ